MEHLLRDKIKLFQNPTKDIYGKLISSGSYTNERARIVLKLSVVKDEKGEDIQADGYGLIAFSNSIELNRKFEYDTQSYRIVAKEVQKAMNTGHHIKFYFKKINE